MLRSIVYVFLLIGLIFLMIFDDKLLLYLIIFKNIYICKIGCALHKKARALRL